MKQIIKQEKGLRLFIFENYKNYKNIVRSYYEILRIASKPSKATLNILQENQSS